ncbi:MAG: SEC-C domain-containing protein [Syntrophomonadaceae bacterium]|nr:SEC-C domain-containing protein [Syntrophomonadaceae bacterium]
MSKTRAGRNEPCPCGSGKKYKNCCWELDELIGDSDNPFDRANELMMQCKMRLEREYEDSLSRLRQDFLQRFLAHTVEMKLPEAQETFYSDWLWFDLLDEDDNTLAWEYMNRNLELLPQPLMQCLAALALSHLSVYQVVESAGVELGVRDLFTGREILVYLKEPFEMPDKSEPLLLLGRLVFFKDAAVFSGMVLVINDQSGISDFICEHVDFLQAQAPDLNHAEVLKFNSARVFGIFDHASRGRYLAMNDMRCATVDDGEAAALRGQLDHDRRFAPELSCAGIDWYLPAERKGFRAIGLGPQKLILCSEILSEMKESLDFLMEAAEGIAGRLTVFHNNLLGIYPEDEYTGLWLEATRLRESDRWLRTPYPELDGKTPQEARTDEAGRERLHQLLNDLSAKAEEGSEGQALLEYLRLRIV